MPEAQPLILKDPNNPEEQQKVFLYLLSLTSRPPIKAFMAPEVAGSIWKDNVKIAEENNHPGKFTAFCSYEWTSMPNNRNLHRNIFFRDCAHLPAMPYSSLDSNHPEDLWNWMDTQRKAGNELLAISHNANVSDGWMYPVDLDSFGRPIDAAWASSRDRNERLVEIKQIKGASETHPSVVPQRRISPATKFSVACSVFRQTSAALITFTEASPARPTKMALPCRTPAATTPISSAWRRAPTRTIPGALTVRTISMVDTPRRTEPSRGAWLGSCWETPLMLRLENPGGLTGVWAEENTRASIWDAMYRKETFGVSGPHIKVRFFGGWGYSNALLNAKDWVHQSYANGVPMGADLPPMKGTAPTFVVWAVKDPTSGNLDRIQIIKGWTKNGQSFEKIFDVAWAGDRKLNKWTGRVPAIQNTVDLEKATYTNSVGSTELKTVWTDPEFDASLHAFYYARVLEIPTPRWTLIQAVKAGIPPPDIVPLTGQERAWTSPIWYTPSADARKNAPAGLTVADLKTKGATALGDAQLKALIVGKAFWVRNNVTGEQFSVSYTAEGQSNVWHVGKSATIPSSVGDPTHDGYLGTTTPYKIENGKVVTTISQDPFAITIYKLGDTYYGARSNEFGYANYEIIPTPQIVMNPLTAMINQFAIELGSTEQQKQQIVPILKQEAAQLEALKKNTSLTPLQKIEQLKQISSAVDAKITPLLDPAQQQKFNTIREENRRKLIEELGSKALQKVKGEIKQKM